MKCSICDADFTFDEGGVSGSFGILPVSFCAWCLSCMEDMFDDDVRKEQAMAE